MWGQKEIFCWRKECSFSTTFFSSLLFLLCGIVFYNVDAETVINSPKALLSEKDFQRIFINSGKIRTISNFRRTSRQEENGITLVAFLQQSVKRYGQKRVANSIHELAQNSMYDLIWLLAGDLEPWLIYDLYQMYNSASSDERVLSVYEKFRAGQVNRSIVPEVFALDKKYNEFSWYKRVRSRLLENVDKYMAMQLIVSNTPPKIEFGEDGKPIIEGKKPESAINTTTSSTNTDTNSDKTPSSNTDTEEEPDDIDETSGVTDFEDLLGGFIS